MAQEYSKHYESIMAQVGRNMPNSTGRDMDVPLDISMDLLKSILHVVHDVGGQPDGPLDKSERKSRLWEKNIHCTAECLSWRGHFSSEERRRRENDLGEAIYFATPYYARWLLATVHMLLEKRLINMDELIHRIALIKKREEGLS